MNNAERIFVLARNSAEYRHFVRNQEQSSDNYLYAYDANTLRGCRDFFYVKLPDWKLNKSQEEIDLFNANIHHGGGIEV